MFKYVTLISCPNGFGHFYRLISLAKFLRTKNFRIFFICSIEQKKKINKIKGIKFIPLFKNQNLKNDPFGFLLKFYHKNINDYGFIKKSNIIISDNLINKIYIKKKYFLISNFFWGEIKNDKYLQRFKYKRLENYFLKSNKFIFQNKYFNSSKKIKSKKINFFGKSCKNSIYDKNKIFCYISEKDKIPDNYLKFLKQFKIYTNNKRVLRKHKNYNFFNLDSIGKVYKKFKFIFAKPGLSSIADAIKYKIPLITFKLDSDSELNYNLKKIKEYNIGIILNNIKYKKLFDINNNSKYLKYIKNLNFFKFNGEKEIYKFIKKEY